jgi:LysR family hydrogen peroxide-inducible transcriptional activator
MNLRDLNYVIAVAELRSFVQAAERCCISQPTLSMQIRKLEDELGVQLFERTNKSVLPTAVGGQIIEAARRIASEVESIREIADAAKDPLAGNLRLGAFPTLSTYLFPALVPLIRHALPRVKLTLVEEKTEGLIQQLKTGQLDAALLALPVLEDGLETARLFEDEFLLATPANHPMARRKSIDPAELAGQSLLLLDEGHCLRGQALQVCRLNGANEEHDVRATGLETLRGMVRAGLGITLMPRIAARQTDDRIRYIPFAPTAPSRVIGLVWRKTSARTALFAELSDLARQAAG